MIKEITKYIEEEADGFVIGTNLFAGFVPSTITADHVVILESGGKPNFYITDAKAKAIQVLSRAKDYFDARANALKVYDLIHGLCGVELPVVTTGEEYYVNTIEAITEPQSLGQDESGKFLISTNYVLRVQDKT